MQKSGELLVHILFWIAFTSLTYILLLLYLRAVPEAPFAKHLAYVIFLEVAMGLIFFYITFYGIRWAGRSKPRISILVSILLILLLVFTIPAMKIGIVEVLSSIVPYLILIFLGGIFRSYSDSQKLEAEKKELLLQNLQGELALLRMQLSPHFLFNTLNNIDYLISADPPKASDSISKLGTILRYMIYETGSGLIDLEKEVRHIEDYIELIRLRVMNRDYLEYSHPDLRGRYRIAPMIFLPFIENAFKHSGSREAPGVIKVRMSLSGKSLSFSVINTYSNSGKKGEGDSGIGLKNVKRRLELLYPGKHSLTISDNGNLFSADLKLELDED
jgi:two-component system, LytTR family, sensor kinase